MTVVFGETDYLALWMSDRFGFDIAGTRVSPSGGLVGDPFVLTKDVNSQSEVALAFDGTNYLAVWADDRTGLNSDIYASRISRAGTLLDPQGIAIRVGVADQVSPEVFFDGTNFLVVWEERPLLPDGDSDILGARVSTAGVLLDSTPIAISTAVGDQRAPDVALNGSSWLVAWDDRRAGQDQADIYGARVAGDGTVLDPAGIPISTLPSNQRRPSIACDPADCLVVWGDTPNFIVVGPHDGVDGARVAPNGTVLDPAGIPISVGPDLEVLPDLAFDGTNYLVVWLDRSFPFDIRQLYGARVSPAGTKVGAARVRLAPLKQGMESASVAFTRTQYIVFWQRFEGDVHATRVTKGGLPLDLDSVRVAVSGVEDASPHAISAPGERATVAYVRYRQRATQDFTERAFLRTVSNVDRRAPETKLISGPNGLEQSRAATFRFSSNEAPQLFQCSLDFRPWGPCASPRRYLNLAPGLHTFRVRARDRAGNVDATPFVRKWWIDR